VHRTSGLSAQLGSTGASVGTEVLSLSVQDADASTAVLGTPQVISLERLRTADGVPIAVIHTWLPAPAFADLTAESLQDASLQAVLEEEFAVQITSGKRQIRAVPGDRDLLRLLQLDTSSPVLPTGGHELRPGRAARGGLLDLAPPGPHGVRHRHPAGSDGAGLGRQPTVVACCRHPDAVADRARRLGTDLLRLADRLSHKGH
jgi:GntR family transcriptional regulator